MPRRHRSRRRVGGGFFDSISSWGSSLWQKTKSSLTGSTYSPSSSYTSQQSSYGQESSYTSPQSSYTSPQSMQPMTTSTYGGRRRTRRMKGGFKDNTPTTGLAAHAATFSGVTAKPHNLVGGKTRRRGRKSRKHRKH
jgi:hypothetical protein